MQLPVRSSFLIGVVSLALSGCNTSAMITNPSGNPGNPANPSGSGSSNSILAYVYVVNQTATGGPNQVVAYSADSNGQLTAVSGSPFSQNVGSMAANGSYLVASSATGPDINSYMIGTNGALTLATQFNYGQQTGYMSTNGTTCGAIGGLIFDRTGQFLYGTAGNFDCSSNAAIASFAFDSSNQTLSYLGNVNIGYNSSGAIAFLGNNDFAYSAFPGMYWTLLSFAHDTNGLLVSNPSFSTVHPIAAPPGSTPGLINGYTPGFTAADAANHVAMAEFPDFSTATSKSPPVQLAVYTADSNGILSTSDTYATMPATGVTTPLDLEASPSGSLLAVAGTGGLQIFNFNGGNSLTNLTGVLTTDNVARVAWDSSNHLYAIVMSQTQAGSSPVPGKLHVFTVTSSGATEAPGSPYTIQNPLYVAVSSQGGN